MFVRRYVHSLAASRTTLLSSFFCSSFIEGLVFVSILPIQNEHACKSSKQDPFTDVEECEALMVPAKRSGVGRRMRGIDPSPDGADLLDGPKRAAEKRSDLLRSSVLSCRKKDVYAGASLRDIPLSWARISRFEESAQISFTKHEIEGPSNLHHEMKSSEMKARSALAPSQQAMPD
jgi:hypothetical protein